MHRLYRVQEHVLQALYQAEHLPGQSCLSSIQIPGTSLYFQNEIKVRQEMQDLTVHQ